MIYVVTLMNNISDFHNYSRCKNWNKAIVAGSKLTLVPAGPCCPSEPFADSREKEGEVTENHQSCIVNQQGNGSVCIQMHVQWLILCSQKHLQIARMRQTHSYAWSSRSPCFPFLTFAARLPWVSSITLTVTQVAIVMQIFLFKQITFTHNKVCF